MQSIKPSVTRIIIGTMTMFLLACAIIAFTTPNVQATPQIAKGKPCNTCHEGSPPSKSNVKK
jgi:Mn2+/Fe2+ NRAMP family transporter